MEVYQVATFLLASLPYQCFSVNKTCTRKSLSQVLRLLNPSVEHCRLIEVFETVLCATNFLFDQLMLFKLIRKEEQISKKQVRANRHFYQLVSSRSNSDGQQQGRFIDVDVVRHLPFLFYTHEDAQQISRVQRQCNVQFSSISTALCNVQYNFKITAHTLEVKLIYHVGTCVEFGCNCALERMYISDVLARCNVCTVRM